MNGGPRGTHPKQQTVELIRTSERILLVTHTGLDGDAIGSTLALLLAPAKMGKDVSAATPETPPPVYQFLPSVADLAQNLGGTKDFMISLTRAELLSRNSVIRMSATRRN